MAKITLSRLLKNGKEEEIGFGARYTGVNQRLINPDGSFNVERKGMRGWNPYQALVEMSWAQFFMWVVLYYTTANLLFACIYVALGTDQLSGVEETDIMMEFVSAFFFSVQTFTTVGYGAVSPRGVPANIVAAFGALFGLVSFSVITGLVYGRFSKPRAKILFSRHALIAPFKDGASFQFRIANRRRHKVINLRARMVFSWVEEGKRHYRALQPEFDNLSLFPLNWTIVHAIGPDSPLLGLTEADLEACHAEVIVMIEGYDESFSQTVYANNSYTWREILWNRKFKPMFYEGHRGQLILDLRLIDDSEAV